MGLLINPQEIIDALREENKDLYRDIHAISVRVAEMERLLKQACSMLTHQEDAILTLQKDIKKEIVSSPSYVNQVSALETFPKETIASSQRSVASPPKAEIRNFQKQTLYYGPPNADGFTRGFELRTRTDPKALYAVDTTSPTTAVYYPMPERFVRFRDNANTLLYPLCEVNGDILGSQGFTLEKSDLGELKLDNESWIVTKKCIVNCK